jgi:CRISPR/Cas system-associated endoribonuclease Cas2
MKARYGEAVRLMLGIVGVAGVVVVGAVAPGLFRLLPRPERKSYTPKLFDQTLRRLQRKGLIQLVPGKTGRKLSLTDRGLAIWTEYEIGSKLIRHQKRWDNKWRLLSFDIQESRKRTRNKIRRLLMQFGFHRLQDSVWVYPYECRDVLELLRTHYGIRHEALYLLVEHIDNDRWLKRQFKLV